MVTIWRPEALPEDRPKYAAIADAIATSIHGGSLGPGDRLPTHRELARRLGVTIGTVTRGYAEASRRGLVDATIGRGTFVAAGRAPETCCRPLDVVPGAIDLGLNCPAPMAGSPELQAAFANLGSEAVLAETLRYGEITGRESHRTIIAAWLSQHALPTRPDQLAVTTGCQHAILLAIAATCRPGTVLLTEELTYMGAMAAARMLGVRLETVRIDANGVVPEDFERACAHLRPAAFYCVPTLQNPTSTVMPTARRREIARIADNHGVPILEDDVQGYLVEDRPAPLVTFSAQPSYYMSSLSKSVAGGLRTGYLRTTDPADDRIVSGMWATTLNAPTPLAEVATRLMQGGGLQRIEAERRAAARRRNRIARERLADFVAPGSSPASQFLWLELPDWNVDAVIARTTQAGVRVIPAIEFAVAGKTERRGIRVSLAHEGDDDRFEEGLSRLHGAITGGGSRRMPGL